MDSPVPTAFAHNLAKDRSKTVLYKVFNIAASVAAEEL
jgi:hypothetical protein